MAFKLDIDTESIEQALMKQIAEDDALLGMISEMFFEQHHNGTEVSDPSPSPSKGTPYTLMVGGHICGSRGRDR